MSWCPPKAKTHRPRGFADWSPKAKSKRLLADVEAVLESFAKHLPLTVRQVFYRLVATTGYPKTETAYKNLGEMLVRARRAGLIPWEAIRDDGFHRREGSWWGRPQELLDAFSSTIDRFRLDRQSGQLRRVVVWCEAGGMVPQLERACSDYSVPVFSSGGFDSVTVKHDIAKQFAEMGDVLVLHIGDHDPSGVHVFGSLDGDIRSFLERMGGTAEFVRLAVTPEQIAQHSLPTSPPKPSDRRTFYGDTVQAEALSPAVLAEVVRVAIRGALDQHAMESAIEAERLARQRLQSWWSVLPKFDDHAEAGGTE
jgi:hypothetical protein